MKTIKKPKSPWMRFFVIGPKKTDADCVKTEGIMRANDYKHQQSKSKR